jgi:hypothetical protein
MFFNNLLALLLQGNSRNVNTFLSVLLASKLIVGLSLALALFFYCAEFPSCRNHLYWDLIPRQIFIVLVFVPVISSPKQTELALVMAFYCA